MIEIYKDLWDCDGVRCITTNGFVKSNGRAVMGAGVAKEARSRIPDIDLSLGRSIRKHGNVVARIAGPDKVPYHHQNVLAFPVKHVWWEQADLELIRSSAVQLSRLIDQHIGIDLPVYLPKPGCGNGGLTWPAVRGTLADVLDQHRNLYIIDKGYDVANIPTISEF